MRRAMCGTRAGSSSASRACGPRAGPLREVASWDQPIYTQPEGGILGLIAREHAAKGVEFLLYAKAEPGNIGVLQLCPSIQSTWSNIRRAHGGKLSPMLEVL